MSRIHLLNRMTEELKLIQTLRPSARQPCYLGERIQWWSNLHDVERWVDGGLCRLRLLRLGIDSRQDGRVLLPRHLARDARLLVDTHLGGLSDLLERNSREKGMPGKGSLSLSKRDGVTVQGRYQDRQKEEKFV